MCYSIIIARHRISDTFKARLVVINVVIRVMMFLVVSNNVLAIDIHVYASAWSIVCWIVSPVVRRAPHAVRRSVEVVNNNRC